MYNHLNEIENKASSVEMPGGDLETTTEALEMYHEAIPAEDNETVEVNTSEGIEDTLELTADERAIFDGLDGCLGADIFEREEALNPNALDASVEESTRNICRESRTPQNYCIFAGASR